MKSAKLKELRRCQVIFPRSFETCQGGLSFPPRLHSTRPFGNENDGPRLAEQVSDLLQALECVHVSICFDEVRNVFDYSSGIILWVLCKHVGLKR
jgi:hypothetical protein